MKRIASFCDGFARPESIAGIILIPLALISPYFLYMFRGGVPEHLPRFMTILYPLLVFACLLLGRARTRAAVGANPFFFLTAGITAVAVSGIFLNIWADPLCEAVEATFFYREMLDTLAGGFFRHPEELRTEFAIHFSPVLLFVHYGLFQFFPYPATLSFVTAITLSAAIPIAYKYLKLSWGSSESALLAFGAVLYPSILSLYLGFSPVRFVPAAFWLAFLGYRTKNSRLFLLAFVFCLMIKETIFLGFFMFSVMALLERRSRSWIIVPGFLAVAAFLFLNQYLLPKLADTPEKTSTIAAQFGYWGYTATAVIKTWVTDPTSILPALLRLNNLAYLIKLGHGTGFLLPIGSPAIVIAFPDMFINMVAGYAPHLGIPVDRPGPWTSLLGHYSATIGTAIWCAATEAWAPKRHAGESEEEFHARRWRRAVLLFLAVLSTVIYPTNAESL